LEKTICLTKTVLESILNYSKYLHPKEGILLLRGKNLKEKLVVNEVVIPPQAIHGEGFSTFPVFMLPFDPSIVGSAHSHPSGILKPSIQDLNHFYGKIMVIVGYPYMSERNIAVFNRKGQTLKHEIIPDED